ncbi:Disease resistance protein RPS6 [Cardamine amara subsp. amara]|uniref:Disease resistance protein RPS6 n=1 Tax=Cardamine amara subsp. amara TaxID=228776 RepID=A0ABD0ZFL8_CARAN
MHYLIELMARQIVRQESEQVPGVRRVLWDTHEICEMLRHERRGPEKCMALHMCEMRNALDLGGYTNYRDTLRFLKIYKHSNHIESMLRFSSNDTNLLSSRLRLLHWDTFPLKTFPCRFRPQDLVEVSLHHSNLMSFWKETVGIPNLRRLDVSGSENLEQLPDLSMSVNLEELITQGCKRLKRIPESICNLTRLTKLDVSYCDELNSYHITITEFTGGRPQIFLFFSGTKVEMESIANLSIGGNIHIHILRLYGNADHLCLSTEQQAHVAVTKEQQQAAHKKQMFPGIGLSMRIGQAVEAIPELHGHEWMMCRDQQVPHNQQALKFSMRTSQEVQAVPEFQGHESMKKSQQKARPTSEFHGFNSMDIIRFNYNSDGASFLCYSLSMFPCLKELNLINLNIKVIPDDICALQLLEKLDWSGNDFETLPETMNQLPRLKYATLSNCSRLKALPELVQLERIKLSGCMNLQSLFKISHGEQDWGRFRWLELWVEDCKNIQSISDQLGHFIKLSYVDLSSNDFVALHSSIGDLSSLETLCLNKCKKLKSIKGFLLCLKYLYAHGCESLKTISLPLNHSIKHLDLSHCFSLKKIEHLVTRFLQGGLNEEDSPRFACFPGTKVPNYFDDIGTGYSITIGLPPIWPPPKVVGFDGCIMIACERSFHLQLSPFSYDWDWGYERYFHLHLKPDLFHCRDNSLHSTEEEEEEEEEEEGAVRSDHLVIIRGIKNISDQINKFGIQTHLKFVRICRNKEEEIERFGQESHTN